MEKKKVDGILLFAHSYLERKKILKIFTSDGLLSLFAKKTTLSSLYTPFIIGEWIYEKKNKELLPLVDASIINDLSDLRQTYETLFAAGQIADALLKSQLSQKPSPLLYALTIAYFEKLATFEMPQNLVASFRLKLLLHEGLLNLQNKCSICSSYATSLDLGESLCHRHRSPTSISFSEEEWRNVHELTFSRRFEDFKKINLTEILKEKIKLLGK